VTRRDFLLAAIQGQGPAAQVTTASAARLMAASPWPTTGRNTTRKDLRALTARGVLRVVETAGQHSYQLSTKEATTMAARTTPPEHGTMRGWRSHRRLKTPACEPCLTARREDGRAKEAARWASTGQQAWNQGMVGVPKLASTPRTEQCSVEGCGTAHADSVVAPQPGMILVLFPGSREPARWYCAGWCGVRGAALAEVRAIGGAA
jgi:hypothetical protein